MGECTNALNLNPNYHRALVRRAKASEQLGLYKKALQDIQKANKTDTANPDTQASPQGLLSYQALQPRPQRMQLCLHYASGCVHRFQATTRLSLVGCMHSSLDVLHVWLMTHCAVSFTRHPEGQKPTAMTPCGP